METLVEGKGIKVTISRESDTAIIGERINPTGKKKIAAALEEDNFDYLVQEAILQVEAGAHIIDVTWDLPESLKKKCYLKLSQWLPMQWMLQSV